MIKGNKKMREKRGTEIDRLINTEMTREAHRQKHKLMHTHTRGGEAIVQLHRSQTKVRKSIQIKKKQR